MDPRARLVMLAFGFQGCMAGVAVLAQFIEPGGWAVWPALALLALAVVIWARVAAIVRRWGR